MSDSEHPADLLPLVTEAFAATFRDAALEADSDFFDLGGDSLAALTIALALETALGRPVHPSVVIQHATIHEIATALAA